MPPTSRRAAATQFSPIRKLMPLADQALRAGKIIHQLNIGQPDIPTPVEFFEGLKNLPKVLAYSPSPGLAEAISALQNYYHAVGLSFKTEEIIVTIGGSEAVVFALLAVTDPGDKILVPEPFYTNYKSYATMAGVQITPIKTELKTGFHLPERPAIERLIDPRTKAILFSSPGNPTGVVYTRAETERLAAVAKAHDLFLIADEVYREFVYEPARHTSIFHLSGIQDRAILVDSISKRFSACGARIGALASHNEGVMQAVLKFAQARLSPPTLGQLGLINLLRTPAFQQGIAKAKAEFRRRRDVAQIALSKIKGVTAHLPEGAFYSIVGLPVDDAEKFCVWLLTDFDHNGETVMLAPAADFYATPGRGQREVRLAYVLEPRALERAIQVLAQALKKYPGAGR